MKVKDLRPNPENPRTISEPKLAMLRAALEEFGDLGGFVFNRKTKQLVGGHQRAKLFDKKAEVTIEKKYPKPTRTGTIAEGYVVLSGERFRYREVDWNPVKEKAANIAANKGAGEWNMPKLSEWIADLASVDFNLDLTMFDESERARTTVEIEKIPGKCDPDEVPEAPKVAKTVLGDVYQLGNHRLMCGDSTSITDIEKLMAGARAQICFTSPPYNAGSMDIKGQKGTGKKYNSFDDNQTEDEYRDFIIGNLNCILSVCDEALYNIGLVEGNKRVIIEVMGAFREQFKDVLYWKKSSVAPHIQKGIVNNLVEFILCFGNGKRKFEHAQFSQGTYFNVIEGPNAAGNEFSKIHKATFPVYLPENIIENFCPKGGLVLDTFGGTGTTMIAAEQLSRRAYLMELDPVYCDVIVARWEKFTGDRAKLLTGESELTPKPVRQGKNKESKRGK